MQRFLRPGLLGLLALGLLTSCSKKTMQQPPPTPPPATSTEPPPPPPPPTQEAPPPAAAAHVELQDAFFDYDSFGLRDDARSALTEDGKALVATTGTQVTIEGHCDERGTVDYNLALGEKRANAAKDFLVSYGVPAERMTTISYGENRPFDPGHDEAAWAKNRRAHFVAQ